MFQRAAAFNQPIGSWTVSQVTDTSYMFESAVAFNHDITGWTRVTTSSTAMFRDATAWLAIYSSNTVEDGPASAWSLGSQYCGENGASRPARASRAPPGTSTRPATTRTATTRRAGRC